MTDRQNSTDSLRIRQRACKKYERAGRVQDARIRCAARTIYPPRSAASVWAESARSEVLLSMEHADKYRAKRASSDEPKPSRGHEALAIGRLGKVCKLARGRRQMADGATSLVRLRASSGTLRPSMDGRGTSGLRTSVVGLVLTARHNTTRQRFNAHSSLKLWAHRHNPSLDAFHCRSSPTSPHPLHPSSDPRRCVKTHAQPLAQLIDVILTKSLRG